MAPSKILLCVNTTWNVYNFRSGLIESLISDGYDVTVVTPKNTGDDNRITALGCKHLYVNLYGRSKNPLKELRTFFQYLKILHAEKPDCVLLFTIKPNLYMGLACKLLKISYINNITGLGTIFLKNGLLSSLIKKIYKISLSSSRRVFFQNPDDQELFIQEHIVSPTVVGLLPGSGINLDKFPFSSLKDRVILRRPFKFLLAARLLWSKGIFEYVEAARILKSRGHQVEFHLLGFVDGNDREAVSLEKVNAWSVEGLIYYKGHTDNIHPHLLEADCVVLPSYREGTPRILLEAMAVGRPIITTNVPGCREVLDEGKNGYFCEVRDAESLAFAMERMMALPFSELSEMSIHSRRKADTQYSEELVCKSYSVTINSLIRTKILLCVNTTWNVYNFRSGLIESLISDGYDVTVVTPKNTGDDNRITALGCKHLYVNLYGRSKNPLKELRTFFQYLKILHAEKPDCVLLFTIKPNLYMGLACKLLKISYINNITGLGTIFLKNGLLSSLIKKIYKISLSSSRRVFFQNPDDQELFIQEHIVSPTVVGLLPGSGINLDKFPFSSLKDRVILRRPFKFLLAARLLWSKGIFEYVEAARILKSRGHQVEFHLLGFVDGNDREAVSLEKVNAWSVEGLIYYKGHTDNIHPHLLEADCVVLPTFYREGTPRILLEAMAVGRPIITTNVPGCREVLDEGKNGYFCEVRDAESLAFAMERMMALPFSELSEMSIHSRRKAENLYDEKFVNSLYTSAIQLAVPK